MPSVPRFRPGMNLAERAAFTAELEAARTGRPTPQPAAPGSRRHCWVHGTAQLPGRWPGLLVEWARSGDVWRGRVVYVVDDDGPAVLVESWVAADQLEPR